MLCGVVEEWKSIKAETLVFVQWSSENIVSCFCHNCVLKFAYAELWNYSPRPLLANMAWVWGRWKVTTCGRWLGMVKKVCFHKVWLNSFQPLYNIATNSPSFVPPSIAGVLDNTEKKKLHRKVENTGAYMNLNLVAQTLYVLLLNGIQVMGIKALKHLLHYCKREVQR